MATPPHKRPKQDSKRYEPSAGLKVVALVGLLNAVFYSSTISTESFPSALTGMRFGGEPLLLQSINHTASLKPYPHYLLYVSSEHYYGRLACAGLFLVVQLVVTVRGLAKYLPLGLSAELVAWYWWCLSASLVMVGAFALRLAEKVYGPDDWVYTLAMSVLAFFGWWHVYYDVLLPLGLHVNPTGSAPWGLVVKYGCFPFALVALAASFAIGWRSNEFFSNLHLITLMNLQLFAHCSYWLIVTYRAFTGDSSGWAGSPAVQRYLDYALCFHATYDMTNQYIPNPENSNANTTVLLAFLLMMMNLSFDKFMREHEKSGGLVNDSKQK